MRRDLFRRFPGLIAILLAASACLQGQPQETFRWMDFHSPKDQSVLVWVTRSLDAEKWTAIREIGVKYDAALVITTLRATPQTAANADSFTVWNVSLTNHSAEPIIKGVNLRLLDWLEISPGDPQELGVLYDNCRECAADTFFTAFYYDLARHGFTARWLRGGQGVPLWSANVPEGISWTQIYAALADPDGRQFVATWNHFEYGKQKPAEDFIYRYDIDPFSGLDRTEVIGAKDLEGMKQRLCSSPGAIPGLARGQDSELCRQLTPAKAERRPVTTPPANNRGQSLARGVTSRH